ncbi:hypothetical protein [uncultured Draconibacterium sp.]|uniref:hypothetical protein n=1 Tax=uncultured Draconibacterium sp. TaxID=1573823 RepID=UPI003748FF99
MSFERMEVVNGGSSCGWAIGVAAFSAVCVVGATIVNPGIWAVPATWYGAATLAAGNIANVYSSC